MLLCLRVQVFIFSLRFSRSRSLEQLLNPSPRIALIDQPNPQPCHNQRRNLLQLRAHEVGDLHRVLRRRYEPIRSGVSSCFHKLLDIGPSECVMIRECGLTYNLTFRFREHGKEPFRPCDRTKRQRPLRSLRRQHQLSPDDPDLQLWVPRHDFTQVLRLVLSHDHNVGSPKRCKRLAQISGG